MREFEDNCQEISVEKCGIYIHIPFCRKKCLYCDFFSGGAKNVDWQLYADAIVNELKERRHELLNCSSAQSLSVPTMQSLSNPAVEQCALPATLSTLPATLYIGGGTPSLMPVEVMREMVAEIKRIVGKTDSWEEFTIEINPEDVTEDNCRAWRECGVNRVSMGIQTLNDAELKAIGRTHDSAAALSGLRMLKRYFDNVTIDLIFGLPNQTIDSWRKTVDTVLREHPQHISAYSLMFEEGTAMTILRDQGRLSFPDEEVCLAMWNYLTDTLAQNGYRRYEISNYALPGYESIHNRRYWLGNPYIGLGVAAHSYDGNNIRRANPHNIRAYISRFNPDLQQKKQSYKQVGSHSSNLLLPNDHPRPETTGAIKEVGEVLDRVPFYEEEKLTDKELLEEKVMLSMRMAEGLDLDEFRTKFGENTCSLLLKAAEKQIKAGNLALHGNHLRLTPAGIMISDDLILQLIM
ncbi:MAG: coproporphyrinogen III oxidase family protein [Muribaculaceae bacterium]|nr:coproporphyrinogen III oxidase family protein [Muribaculaceae bacterium]